MNLIKAWSAAVAHFGLRLRRAAPDDYTRPTPCGDWTVYELIDHVFEVQRRVPAALGQPPRHEMSTPEAWQQLCRDVSRTIAAEDTLSRNVETGLGPMTASDMLYIATADCLTHTWDLARAFQLHEQLPTAAVRVAFDFMQPLDELLRGPNMLGPKLETPENATLQTQFLCFAGRNVNWTPESAG
jgi:uncharacterized protein (TIGR03086 family)